MAARSPNPGPLPAELAFRQLVRVFGKLERLMHPYFAAFGISGAQWGVLRTLNRAEAEGLTGLRLTDLGERLLIRPPSVTGVVDRLQKAGLVSRDTLPGDQRVRQVSLTPRGRQLLARVLVGHAEQISSVMAGLAPDEQAHLHELLLRLEPHLTALIDAGPTLPEQKTVDHGSHG